MKNKIGILAFGSLITEPGIEIINSELDRINCITPFKIEFSRISSTRGNAPTLIPVKNDEKGSKVNAVILVLKSNITLQEAKDMLWRRETRNENKNKGYLHRENPTENQLIIKIIENYHNVEKVIYTSFKQQEKYRDLSCEKLAKFSISSILSKAGELKKDGLHYLLETKKNKIITYKSKKYEDEILKLTKTETLEEAIAKMNEKRKMNK